MTKSIYTAFRLVRLTPSSVTVVLGARSQVLGLCAERN